MWFVSCELTCTIDHKHTATHRGVSVNTFAPFPTCSNCQISDTDIIWSLVIGSQCKTGHYQSGIWGTARSASKAMPNVPTDHYFSPRTEQARLRPDPAVPAPAEARRRRRRHGVLRRRLRHQQQRPARQVGGQCAKRPCDVSKGGGYSFPQISAECCVSLCYAALLEKEWNSQQNHSG